MQIEMNSPLWEINTWLGWNMQSVSRWGEQVCGWFGSYKDNIDPCITFLAIPVPRCAHTHMQESSHKYLSSHRGQLWCLCLCAPTHWGTAEYQTLSLSHFTHSSPIAPDCSRGGEGTRSYQSFMKSSTEMSATLEGNWRFVLLEMARFIKSQTQIWEN